MLLGASLSSERGLHGGLRSSQGEGVWICFVSLHRAWATERGVFGEPAERFIPEDADGRYSQSIERSLLLKSPTPRWDLRSSVLKPHNHCSDFLCSEDRHFLFEVGDLNFIVVVAPRLASSGRSKVVLSQ
ncbi:hypothetical protein KCU91_g51, partial [Aureobasidium melanogenum]